MRMLQRQRRQQRLLQLIRTHTRTARWLAHELGVSARTVFRDVQLLRAQDHAIEGVNGRCGGFRLGSHGPVPLRLGVDQVRELVGALTWATHQEALLSTLDVDALLDGLLGALPGVREQGLRSMFPRTQRTYRATRRPDASHLDALETAIHRGQLAIVAYRDGARSTHAVGAALAVRPGSDGWLLDLVPQSIGLNRIQPHRRQVPLACIRSVRTHPRPTRMLLRQLDHGATSVHRPGNSAGSAPQIGISGSSPENRCTTHPE